MKAALAFLVVATFSETFASKDIPSAVPTDEPCRVRAWVRAPNLEPGKVLQGDVKVKLDGSCHDVSSYSLGLRFAERSWVKTRREGVALPVKPQDDFEMQTVLQNRNQNQSIYEDVVPLHGFISSLSGAHSGKGENESLWDRYESDMKSPELWVVREEERIAFETKYNLFNASGVQEPAHDVVKSFALLVPSTNYPPAFENTLGEAFSMGGVNTAGSEHIFKYFVDVSFSNGTSREIDAGYTSFDGVVTTVVDRHPISINMTATKRDSNSGQVLVHTNSPDKFTLEVTFAEGRHFEQGSTNNITITSHQIGPGLQRALGIGRIFAQAQHKRHWAANHAADNETAQELLNFGSFFPSELQPKLGDPSDWFYPGNSNTDLSHFSQDTMVENGKLFSTEPVTAQFQVPPNAYPAFEMYYQTMAAELSIRLQVWNVSEEEARSDAAPEDEENDWMPAHKTDVIQANIPIWIHHSGGRRTATVPNLVHYLSTEARAPMFVDPVSLPHLLEMTSEERDHLAPHCEAKILAKADDDVVKSRYYPGGSKSPQTNYFVGNTWLKKVSRGNRDGPLQGNMPVNKS